jgi:hypothetical protein
MSRYGEDREQLEVFLDPHDSTINTKRSRQRRADLYDLLESMRAAANHDTAAQSEDVFTVAHRLTEVGRSKGPQIAEHHHRFEETRLTCAIRPKQHSYVFAKAVATIFQIAK